MSIVYSATAWGLITNAPGTGGLSVVLSSGHGARFPNGTQETYARIYYVADPGINEIVKISLRSTDTLSLSVRNYDGRGALNITASGWAIDIVDALMPWKVLAYDAGFFSAVGGGSVTVQSGDVIDHAWVSVGSSVKYRLKLTNISVAGTVNSIVVLFPVAALPAGAKVAQGPYPVVLFDNSASVAVLAWASWAAGATGITIVKADGGAFTASANLTSLAFLFDIEAP